MYRNCEGYADPTVGSAFAHMAYEERKKRRMAAQEQKKAAEAAAKANKAAKDAADGTAIPETFQDFLKKYVYDCADQDALLNVLGGARLMNLKNEPHLGYSTRH